MTVPPLDRSSLAIALLMIVASVASIAARPTARLLDQMPAMVLEDLMPRSFGDWREESEATIQIVNPQTQKMLAELYSQTLSRNYVDANGYRIMVALAYGGDQRRELQVHKPEVCYVGVGFTIERTEAGAVNSAFGIVPAQRVFAVRDSRKEPITYWWKVGDKVVRGDVQRKLAEMRYTLTGTIPDGLLVRLSSIDADPERAYGIHEAFAAQLFQVLDASGRRQLAGL
jgi:EpsI family protein